MNCPDFLTPDRNKVKLVDPEEIKDQKLIAESEFIKGYSGSKGFHHERMGYLLITNNNEIRNVIRDNFVLLKEGTEFFFKSIFCTIRKKWKTKRKSDR